MDRLLNLAARWPAFAALAEGLESGKTRPLLYGLAGSQKTFLAAALVTRRRAPVVYITATLQQAERVREDLLTLLPEESVEVLPPLEVLPFEVIAESSDIFGRRLSILDGLARGRLRVVVAPLGALLRLLMPVDLFRGAEIEVVKGQELVLDRLVAALAAQGYGHVDQVESRGDFAVRGGLVDVFPLTLAYPVRVEFFGDEVDNIRPFAVDTQRSVGDLDRVSFPPAREIVFPADAVAGATAKIRKDLAAALKRLEKAGEKEAADRLSSRVEAHLERLAQDPFAPEMDQYAPYVFPEMAGLVEYLGDDALIFMDDPARLRQAAADFGKQTGETVASLIGSGRLLAGQARLYTDFEGLMGSLGARRTVFLSLLLRKPPFVDPDLVVPAETRPVASFQGQREPFLEEAHRWYLRGASVAVLSATADRLERVAHGLRDFEVPFVMAGTPSGGLGGAGGVGGAGGAGGVGGAGGAAVGSASAAATGGTPLTVAPAPSPAAFWLAAGNLESGFELPGANLIVITDSEVFGRTKRRAKPRPPGEGLRLASYQDLKVGDYVVHVNHGIGKYLGVRTVQIEGISRDYLFIKYSGEDSLYVPTDQLGLVQKYVGAEAEEPRLFKLGGSEWARVKNKVKGSVREMAQELLRLYAVRQTTSAYAFAADQPWQAEFEDSFPYEETPDQLKATDEIKSDMEQPRPMDRLLCGDVGYGKTEVAVRAAFKAVVEGKQVAVLVPTTILAQQHFNTFTERFKGHPFNVGLLSRFRSEAEQEKTLRALRTGGVDVVVGTHRLLQEDVHFKDLGLWVIDEEHRFGVAHKERLKKLREDVHVLSLSATPIPRTMHMALAGIRDMSVIETPPEDRFPVQTFVVEYDEALIADAIRRELDRGGQVYYVQNRVHSIERAAVRVSELVPEARVGIGHGQMREERLERVMLDFLQNETDVLVCTTIIESGIDIPNVNTLIVEEADKMGLAQLYQLRGRVGRSNRLAYAYFTFRREKVLSETAERRLGAIKEFTELGSGFKIALRDLEIRGAGNLLGSEQHGHILAVGFDLYCQMLEDAVKELKGDVPPPIVEPVIELPVNAYIDDAYIGDPRQKIEMYKKIVAIEDAADSRDVREELEDRFGELPDAVSNLLAIARLKAQSRGLGVTAISQRKGEVTVRFGPMRKVSPADVHRLTKLSPDRLSIQPSRALVLSLKTDGLAAGGILKTLEAALGTLLTGAGDTRRPA